MIVVSNRPIFPSLPPATDREGGLPSPTRLLSRLDFLRGIFRMF